MLCQNCGKEIPFVGQVCPWCHTNKAESQRTFLLVYVYGFVGMILGAVLGAASGIGTAIDKGFLEGDGEVGWLIGGVVGGFTLGVIGGIIGLVKSFAAPTQGSSDTIPDEPPSRSRAADSEMAEFVYTALDAKGAERSGSVSATSQQHAVAAIKRMGLFPTSIVRK